MPAMSLPATPLPPLSLPESVDAVVALLAAENYVCDRQLGTALFLALKLARPLFLEGAPGVGKTELAKTLARALNTQLLRVQCYEGLDVAQTAYEWNVARQMIEIRLAEAAHDVDRAALARSLYARSMLIERPLLQALTQTRSPVLLIDELDRADEPFDAYLLEVLAENQITIPELGTIRAVAAPLVLITSNRTREIHDALKRRCLYHWVDFPDAERELEILRIRAPGASQRLGRCDLGSSTCCDELGARCIDASECCDGEACLPVGDGTKSRCGGFECTTLGDSCGSNFECCSRRCEAGACASSTCGSVGDTCTTADDCCIQNTPFGEQRLECRGGSCQSPITECVGCDPLDIDNCCTIDQSVCYEAIDGSSFCGPATCSPLGVACASDDDCCSADGAVCSRSGVPHCAKPCSVEGETGCCRIAEDSCEVGAQCCSGACVAGRCLGADPGCLPTGCHSPNAIGAPLDPGAACDVPSWNPSCISKVCETRPTCCCTAWTFSCAQDFANRASGTCE